MRTASTLSQAEQLLDTGTNTLLDVTSPGNVLIGGQLENGAIASVHIGAISFAGSGYRMEIYGRDRTLIATGEEFPQLGEVFLLAAKGNDTLAPMPVPKRFTFAAPGTPSGEPTNVGQMYSQFAQAIRGGESRQATFATAIALHHWVHAIK